MMRGVVRALALAGMAGAVAACGEAEPADRIAIQDVPAGHEDDARKIVRHFADTCPDLFEHYWSDVTEVEARVVQDPYIFLAKTRGWPVMVRIKLKIADEPRTIPKDFHAWGHTVRYHLGGGDDPGVVMIKDQAKSLCPANGVPGHNLHVKAPELALVDKLRD